MKTLQSRRGSLRALSIAGMALRPCLHVYTAPHRTAPHRTAPFRLWQFSFLLLRFTQLTWAMCGDGALLQQVQQSGSDPTE